MFQVVDASAIIGIGCFSQATVSDFIQLNVSNLIRLTVFYWIWLSIFLIQFDCSLIFFLGSSNIINS